MLGKLTVGELAFVTPKKDIHRLDMLLQPARSSAASLKAGVFETLHACALEDGKRARALTNLKANVIRGMSDADTTTLAGLLHVYAAHVRGSDPCWLIEKSTKLALPRPRPCLASATYMRDRRIGILGAILDLVADCANLEIAWITATDPSFSFDQTQSWSEIVARTREQFLQEMEFGCDGCARLSAGLLAWLPGPSHWRLSIAVPGHRGRTKTSLPLLPPSRRRRATAPSPISGSHASPVSNPGFTTADCRHDAEFPRRVSVLFEC